MDELVEERPQVDEPSPAGQWRQPISGTYAGTRGLSRLELRIDLREDSPYGLHQPLNLLSGDLFRGDGAGQWDYRSSFIVEHPQVQWGADEVEISGQMLTYRNLDVAGGLSGFLNLQVLKVSIPVHTIHEPAAAATVRIVRWGTFSTTYLCEKTSGLLRTIELEIDRITGTELPRKYNTGLVARRPPDLPALELDIPAAYQRAGIDLRVVCDDEVFAPLDAGADSKWDENELHHAMEHHFSLWRDQPQWKLYLLVATHFKLYPEQLVTGIMYDSGSRDPADAFPRQGVAIFYSTMKLPEVWGELPPPEFDRNCLRTCVHELGHALNLLHSFDKDEPDSLSWMNYPWRYPYGYRLPPGWDGSNDYWQNCRFEFDPEELRHLRHHALMEVIPGGAPFGALGHDLPRATTGEQLQKDPLALYVRTRPERYLFAFAEPVSVELKLKNQGPAPITVPDMLNPEFGMTTLFIRDPRDQVRAYRPLFKLCGEPHTKELAPGESLYESVFLAFGAAGFYFQEPGEYQVWAVYEAGGLRLRSNPLRIRVAFPHRAGDEHMALLAFDKEQGQVLYMRGAPHLTAGTGQLREVVQRYPTSSLARYIHLCLGEAQAKPFKDIVSGQILPPDLEQAARELERARALPARAKRSTLDNITYGQAVDLLKDIYLKMDKEQQAKKVLTETADYFERMEVKEQVIEDIRAEARAL